MWINLEWMSIIGLNIYFKGRLKCSFMTCGNTGRMNSKKALVPGTWLASAWFLMGNAAHSCFLILLCAWHDGGDRAPVDWGSQLFCTYPTFLGGFENKKAALSHLKSIQPCWVYQNPELTYRLLLMDHSQLKWRSAATSWFISWPMRDCEVRRTGFSL